MAPRGASELTPLRTLLRNRPVRGVTACYGAALVAEWSAWVGILVYAYERGGVAVAGFVSMSLIVPAALVVPTVGAVADGRRPGRTLVVAFAAQAISYGVIVAVTQARWPALVAAVPCAGAVVAITFIRPTLAVVVPSLVRTPHELTAANLVAGWLDSGAVLFGPLVAGGLIAVGGVPAVFAGCGVLTAAGALALVPLARRRTLRFDDAPSLRYAGQVRALLTGLQRLSAKPGAIPLVVVLSGQYVLVAALDLLAVLLAGEVLGLPSWGSGVLTAAVGVGAVVAGAVVTGLMGRPLAPVMLAALTAVCGALLVLGVATTLGMCLVLLPVVGFGRSLLDVTGRMLLLRTAPQDAVASVFATLEALALVCYAAGSLLVQVMVAVSDVRWAIIGTGLSLAALGVLARRLLAVDAAADVPLVAIRLLRTVPVFSPLPAPVLETLARSADAVHLTAGQVVVATGEPGDRYFAVVDGTVEARPEDRGPRVMARGEGFGEIALLTDVPRTATVVALSEVELLSIDRDAFLSAVTGHVPSLDRAWSTVHRYVTPERSTASAPEVA